MPKWIDYKAEAKARGALALEFYVVNTTPAGASDAVKSALGAHLDYQRKLEEVGILAFAGPVSDSTGEMMEGAGMVVYRATSMEHARELADADPMHKSGARTYTLKRWLINEGSFTLNVGLSTGRLGLE